MEIWDLQHPDQRSRGIDVELVSAPLGGVAGSPIFSPDGQWLTLAARGTQTIVLNLWEPTEKPVTIPGMFLVAPGIQGRWLIAIESKEINVTAQLWDLRDLGKGPTPLPEAYACQRFLISLDGHWFATHCNNNVNVWNIEDPAQPQAFSGPLPGYALGAFSADSTQLALFSNRGILEVLDLRSGKIGFPLQYIGQPLSNVRFSPDGRLLTARSGTGSILLWDLSPGTRTPIPTVYHGLGGIEYAVEFFEFTSDGSHIVSVSDDGVTRKWDLSNPYLQSLRLQANGKELPYIASSFFSPDGRWLAFNSGYGVESIRTSALFDLQHLSAGPVPLPMSEGPLLFNPGANQVLLLSINENQIYTWNLADVAAGRLDPVVRDVPGTMIVPAVPDRWLVSQLADNTLQVWDLFAPAAEPKVLRAALPASDSLIKIVTNGKWLWMAGNDATLQRWDLEQPGNAPEMVTPISGFVSAMEISPQGNWLAITDQKTARVWDLRRSAQEPVLDLAADISFGINNRDELLFSTDERRLIVNHGTKIQILNLQNLADEPITLGGVVQEMGGMTLSPDGHWLAGKDVLSSELRLWNLQDLASEPMVLQEQSDVFDFSPDGKWLAMSELSKIGLLRLDAQELLALACEAVGSNLSRRQWTEHFPSQREYVPTCPQWPEGKDKIVVITTG